jgi:hypothetical protein
MKIGYSSIIIITLLGGALCSQTGVSPVSQLMTDFDAETDPAKKEQLLNQVVRQPGAGPELLRAAVGSNDPMTKWMSIRGLGYVKYEKATPFLINALRDQNAFVRANAARALGELKASCASNDLIRLLKHEDNGGVIEQTSLALGMLGAKEAVPTLKSVASHPSFQTRCWILDAIAILGERGDIPFLAKHLYDSDGIVAMSAARAIEKITGEDFGLPKGSGLMSPLEGVERARRWWEANEGGVFKNELDYRERLFSKLVP